MMAKGLNGVDALSYVQIWQGIVSTVIDIDALAEACAAANQQTLAELRKKIRDHLGQLAKVLSAALGAADAQELLLPLVIYCDELVLKRMSASTQKSWPLLQAELYGVNDGGEKFFQLTDERLLQVEPSGLLLEILLYCLGRGFLGRYVHEPAKVVPYKDRLKERLQLHPRKERLAAQYRQAERRAHAVRDPITAAGELPLIAPLALYVATFVLLLAVPFGIVFFSNLPIAHSMVASPPGTAEAIATGPAPPSLPVSTPSPLPAPTAVRAAAPAAERSAAPPPAAGKRHHHHHHHHHHSQRHPARSEP